MNKAFRSIHIIVAGPVKRVGSPVFLGAAKDFLGGGAA